MNARQATKLGGALGAATVATLVAEVAWVVRRPLPSLVGHDASLLVGPEAARPIRLVVLGDSTTTGPGLNGPEQIWLHQALRSMDLEAGIDVRSLAVGGSRVADVLAQVPEVATWEPDAVVVAVGSNDAMHGTPLRRFTRELEAVIAGLLEATDVLAVTNIGDLGSLARVPPPLSSVLHTRSRSISRRIESIVAQHPEVILIDVTTADPHFRAGGVFAPDLFHPNEVGHRHWAAAARPGLEQLLERAVRRSSEPR